MKLVFVTRKVDRQDFLTSFVFGWISKLAASLDKLYVICQEQGDTSGLPANVEVYSFGKEKGHGRFRQGLTLFTLIFKLAGNSQGIFVHMHPIYLITAWLPAKLFGKKIILWYMHKSVDLKLKIAHALADTVLTASPESFRVKSKKLRSLDTELTLKSLAPSLTLPTRGREENSGLFLLAGSVRRRIMRRS